MPEQFIGRRQELGFLERTNEGPGSAMIPIYGRRRIGKSELILRFLEGRRGIYFLGKRAPEGVQIREFLDQAAVALDEPLLARIPPEGWKSALSAVKDRWKGPEKLIIALDEFQWTVEASPDLPSILQELWDLRWKKSGDVLLILCGSVVGFMERELLGRKSPLFGRRTGQIHLQPFDFREAAEFHPAYSLEQKAQAYFLCGGVPLYLRSFSTHRSVEMNVVSTLLDEFSPLRHEPEFLLREELRDLENYFAVLMAIAAGNTASQAIAAGAGIAERSLHYYLEQLSALGYIRRRHPLTGKPPAARNVRYVLDDPLLRFHFRFVYPNTSYLAQVGPRRTFTDRIRPDLDSFFGGCFEGFCREALPALYQMEGVQAAFEIGEYWDSHVQIDIVGIRQDGWIDLGECKWGKVRSAAAGLRELEEKVRLYPHSSGATVCRRIFTRRPVTSVKTLNPSGTALNPSVRWHDLAALYGS